MKPSRHEENDSLAYKNKRLALALGLISLSIYVGYILAYYF